jgi:hypothetical protein
MEKAVSRQERMLKNIKEKKNCEDHHEEMTDQIGE